MPLLNTTDSAAIAADYLDNSARMLVIELDNWSAACDVRSVNAHTFLIQFLQQRLLVVRDKWTVLQAVNGIEAAVRNRWPGKFADDAAVTALLSEIKNGMTTLISWIGTNVQASLVDGAGYVLVMKFTNNAPDYRKITNATACDNLKVQLQALRSLIIG